MKLNVVARISTSVAADPPEYLAGYSYLFTAVFGVRLPTDSTPFPPIARAPSAFAPTSAKSTPVCAQSMVCCDEIRCASAFPAAQPKLAHAHTPALATTQPIVNPASALSARPNGHTAHQATVRTASSDPHGISPRSATDGGSGCPIHITARSHRTIQEDDHGSRPPNGGINTVYRRR